MREAVREAKRFLPELVRAFRALDPEIRAIVLFGSLGEGTVRGEHLDIDIAVRPGRYRKLVAWALDQDFRIVVLDLDAERPHIVDRILTRGEVLHAGKQGL